MDDFAADAETQLRSAGYRVTSSRRQVLSVLADADRALSPYAIREALGAGAAVPDVVTVYRILELLTALDLAHRVHSVNGWVACSRLRCGGCHHPVICEGCGRIEEVEGHQLEPLERDLAAAGWAVRGHVLEFRGLCPACRTAPPNSEASLAARFE